MNINPLVKLLNLDEYSAKILQIFIEKNNATVYEVSVLTGISRTNVYRRVNELLNKGLLIETLKDGKRKFQIISSGEFVKKIDDYKQNLTEAEKSVQQIVTSLNIGHSNANWGTYVKLYQGVSGIMQMYWNVLNAKTELCGYSLRTDKGFLSEKFIYDWELQFKKKKIKYRDIVTRTYVEDFIKGINNSNVEIEIKDSLTMNKDFRKAFAEPLSDFTKGTKRRYVSPDVIKITLQMDIYNDVVAIYNWTKNEIFGIEIINKEFNEMQKQIFEMYWQQGIDIM